MPALPYLLSAFSVPRPSAFLSLLLWLVLAGCSQAAVERASPDSEDFSPERLARIDARMAQAVEDGVMVGGHALIARDGKVVYDQRWGMADRERGIVLQADALYRIYSMTKPITSVALLMLYEEGRFLLEDPVARYLPELAGLTVLKGNGDGEDTSASPRRQPTIRDLMRHTAGFTYGVFGDSAVDRLYRESRLFEAPTNAAFTETLGTLPLLFEPGTRWHYSVSVDVQARLVEVLSGMPFGEFLRTRIFEPLSMHDTSFVIPEDKRDRLTQLYSPIGSEFGADEPVRFSAETTLEPADAELTTPYLDGSRFESGGGGLVSTMEDYLHFALMLAGDGEFDGVRLLAPATVAHMRSDHLQGIDSSGLWSMDGFGLGVGIVENTARKSGELGADGAYGWGGAAGTNFWIDPEEDIVGIFMVQSIPHQTPLSKLFRVLTYQAFID